MNNKIFICYSLKLMLFLRSQNIFYDVEAKHKITGNPMWVYVRDETLNKALNKYSKRR